MSDLPGRLYNIAKGYLEDAKGRLAEIDTQAQAELSNALTHDDLPGGVSAASPASGGGYIADPMERARAKIAASRGQNAARQELSPASEGVPAPPPAAPVSDPVQTAYKILGVAPGSDYPAVQAAVERLRERCAPARFPAGSEEQGEAQIILGKVEEANQLLRGVLNEGAGRFEKLEL